MNPSPILCPFCSKQLVVGSGQSHCHHCQKELPADTRSLLKQPVPTSQTFEHSAAPQISAAVHIDSSKPRDAFIKRYIDLYRTARLLNGLGTTVKVLAFIVGAIIFAFWFFLGAGASVAQQQNAPFGPGSASQTGPIMFYVCLVIGAVFGALTTGLLFLLGVLISAQGQLLKAQADGAVHTSPFLTNEERATAMSLPYVVPAASPLAAGAG